MKATTTKQSSKLIAEIDGEAKKRLGAKAAKQLTPFFQHYFENVPPGDLRGRTPAALFAAAHNHWKLAGARKPGKALVSVDNPNLKKHGWDCAHTVITIVNDDMPFLVDSVTAALNSLDLTVHLVIHPVLGVDRDNAGRLKKLLSFGDAAKNAVSESFMHLEVTEQSGQRLDEIRTKIESVIDDVRNAVADWVKMREKMTAITEELKTPPKGADKEDIVEAIDFLDWAHNDHFTFLGYREYDFTVAGNKNKQAAVNRKIGMGVLRKKSTVVFRELEDIASITPAMRAYVQKGGIMVVTKTNAVATVHRPVHMDSIGIKKYDARGRVVGYRVFVGLFTSSAYNRSARDIPLLRRKLQNAFKESGFASGSHDGKALMNILETYPRDELFQVSDEQLYETALGILHLQERQRVALFVRADDFGRFMSCLIYVPRDHFSTALRIHMQAILESAFAGSVTAYYTQLGDAALARLHVILHTTPDEIPDYDVAAIERKLVEAARSWADRLVEALIDVHGEEAGLGYFQRYQNAFDSAYSERFTGDQAISDINRIEGVIETGELGMCLYRPVDAASDELRFKVYNADHAIPLSDVLPMLEHMGLKVVDEMPFQVHPDVDGERLVMIHDFGLKVRNGRAVKLDAVRVNFYATFSRIWDGKVESDGFNALVLGAGLAWREIVILRAICKYLRQTGIAFSQVYMEETLANNPVSAALIVELFKARFVLDKAGKGNAAKAKATLRRLEAELEKVQSADEDRILRRYINIVSSMLRTNFHQEKDGAPKPCLSFKLNSAAVDDLPLPRPFREIFVYSPRVEGVHLRFGMVARGGLRWSDRREDFRTEILGLVKAQQVKNTVIIPVGSKGGFVLKNPPPMSDRDAFQAEGIACYKTFISGLLDITDNLKGNRVIAPQDTVRHDGDDPYLVVAADKGTATFSDIANSVSHDYGFWLGDAFASGGSVGYDHKAMGITARGAWESVKRHFREMHINIQEQDFTVVGVGDMAGDVFGNGMLLSKHIKLVGAFNHMHIFVDPDPDPAKTIIERRRMFNLPRSSWTDYNTKLISKGGGIFERAAKSITLSPEIRSLFGIDKKVVTPNELISAMLKAHVDLLWFGGIGTYLKSTAESHQDVGDRANDALRINAAELNCRVIGEGANLGVTQRARIEAAIGGVRLYADSIDNSAGVDCSDHEVNIKILIDKVVASGGLNPKQRVTLLASMTEEVGHQVLVDNYLQTQAINMILSCGMGVFDNQVRLMRMLEKTGRLNRTVEFLPDDETLIDRAISKTGLTGPEIAVLMSYAKIWINEELLKTNVPDDPELTDELIEYFPKPLRTKYRKQILGHRLHREIVATLATNSTVNRVGGTFVYKMMERTGMPVGDVVRAYLIARRVLGMRHIWRSIEALDNKVSTAVQMAMILDIDRAIEWVALWFLRNGRRPLDIGSHVAEYADGFKALYACLGKCLPKQYQKDITKRAAPYVQAGVPVDLARHIAGLVNIYSGCDIIGMAARRKLPVVDAARLYFAMGRRFRLGSLRAAADRLEATSHWQKLAVAALIEEIYSHQLALASQVIDSTKGDKKITDAKAAIAGWEACNTIAVGRVEQMIGELSAVEINDLAMIAVASRQLRTLAETPTAKG